MGRQAKDTTLYALACKLKQPDLFTQFSALSDEAEDTWKSGELRNVYLMKDAKTFAVKLFIGNAQRIVGYTINLADACRFADMARWHFAKYRTRDRREPTEVDLNFPVQQVKNDLEHEPKALALLKEIELYLIRIDILNPETPDSPTRVTERRYTVRDDFNTRFDEVDKQFTIIKENIDILARSINAALELFKRGGIPSQHVDTVDAEIIYCEGAEQHMTTGKKVEFTRASLTPIGAIEEIFDPTPTQPNTNQ